jgi:hypothetical protein
MTGEEGHHGRHGKHGRYGDRHRLTGRCDALLNDGWSDEARSASLAVRRAKAAHRKKVRKQQEAEERKKKRDKMFEKQRKDGGTEFAGNWYPRGKDGRYEDPHYGRTTPTAPYGFVDGTNKPRKEPLYDSMGRPIIPRPKKFALPVAPDLFKWQRQERRSEEPVWLREIEKAKKLWGRFGKKKRWMDKNPGATDEEWEKYDKKRYEEWKKRNPRGKKDADGAKQK